MPSSYEKAVETLYQAPHEAFVAERTRLAAEHLLTEGGHAATDATLRRVSMTLSALAVAGGFERAATSLEKAQSRLVTFDEEASA